MTTPATPSNETSKTLPAGQTRTNYNSAFVQVGKFVFNPTLVMGFLHRPATAESVPSTEVLYESHHVTVEDPDQTLFFFLRRQAAPQEIDTL